MGGSVSPMTDFSGLIPGSYAGAGDLMSGMNSNFFDSGMGQDLFGNMGSNMGWLGMGMMGLDAFGKYGANQANMDLMETQLGILKGQDAATKAARDSWTKAPAGPSNFAANRGPAGPTNQRATIPGATGGSAFTEGWRQTKAPTL